MNNEINYVSPFKRFCITVGNLPTAYLESMSYYEGLTFLVNYLANNVIPALNNNGEVVEELQEKFVELKNFVDTYFENLDVQEEVNHKLDEMAESGELTDIIAQYLGLAGLLTYDTVADMKVAENLANGSICKTLGYNQLNDGGSAIYKIRIILNTDVIDEKKIIAIANPSLVAELMVNDTINIKQIGAYGDDTNDDTAVIQYAINNFNNVYVPAGTYKITDQLSIKSNLHLFGDGATSILKSHFTYVSDINYILISDSSVNSITRTIIENLQLANDEVNTLSGGIYVEYSTRGLVLQNLWFNNISNNIKLGEKIWGTTTLTNIFCLYLADDLAAELQDLAIGIYCKGNTTYGKNIEVIGTYHYGIYLNGCQVGSWKDSNISGSTASYQMNNGIRIEDSKEIEVNSCWLEELADGGGVLTKTINIVDSKEISLNNIHFASGSLFIDGCENVQIYNSKYYTVSAGMRYLNNSSITCDKVSLGYCNYQSNIDYNMGIINIIDFTNESNNNIKNNPLYFLGMSEDIAVSNGSFVTKTSDNSNQLTGDRCFNFNSTSNQGASINTSNIFEVGKTYTILAYVKAVQNIKTLSIMNDGSSTVTDYPNEAYLAKDTNYHLLRKTITVSNATSAVKIICTLEDTGVRGDFIVDSVFIVEGKHDNSIPSGLSKDSILRNSKLTASTNPWSGTWSKGSIVYNNFSNSNNDNIAYWIYDGTNWIAHLINPSA